jgi:hypothetical protein
VTVCLAGVRRLVLSAALPAALLLVHPAPAADDPEAWRVRAAFYAWAPSVEGNLTARGQTVDVNASFVQVLQKSDSLLGFMGYFEADKGPVGFYLDTVWASLGFDSSSASWRNPVAGLKLGTSSSTAVTYSFAIIEAGGLYEFARWAGAPGSFTALDGVLGFRYWNNRVEANFDAAGTVDFSRLGSTLGRDIEFGRSFALARSGSLDWVAPVIGLRLRHQFMPAQEITLRGDLGGFGLQSSFEWQALGVYNYAWQLGGYQLAALIGYRALGVNYAPAGSSNSVNLVLHGPVIGASIRF